MSGMTLSGSDPSADSKAASENPSVGALNLDSCVSHGDVSTSHLEQAQVEHLHNLHDTAARTAAIAAAVLGTLKCDHHVNAAVAVAEAMDPAGASYRSSDYADEPSAAPAAADILSQATEQAQVERLYSLHDAAARSAATAAALMNIPDCGHHVASAVMVAELCENPAGAVDKHTATTRVLKPEHTMHGGGDAASAGAASAATTSGVADHSIYLHSTSHPPLSRVLADAMPSPTGHSAPQWQGLSSLGTQTSSLLPHFMMSSNMTDVSTAASSLEAERLYDFVGTSAAQQEGIRGTGLLSGSILEGQGREEVEEDESGSAAAASRVEVWRLAQVSSAAGETAEAGRITSGLMAGEQGLHVHSQRDDSGARERTRGEGLRAHRVHVHAERHHKQPLFSPPQPHHHQPFMQAPGIVPLQDQLEEMSIATARHGPIAKQAAVAGALVHFGAAVSHAADVAVAAVAANELIMRHGDDADEEEARSCLSVSDSPKDRHMETPLWAGGSVYSYESPMPASPASTTSTYGCATPEKQASSPALPTSSHALDKSTTSGALPILSNSPSGGGSRHNPKTASRGCRILPNSPRSSASFGSRSVKWADGQKWETDIEGMSGLPRSSPSPSCSSSSSNNRSGEEFESGGRRVTGQQQMQPLPLLHEHQHEQEVPASDLMTPGSSAASSPFPQPRFDSWSDSGPVDPYGSDIASQDGVPATPWSMSVGRQSLDSTSYMDFNSTPAADSTAAAGSAAVLGASTGPWVTSGEGSLHTEADTEESRAELGLASRGFSDILPSAVEIGPAFIAPPLFTVESASSLAQINSAESGTSSPRLSLRQRDSFDSVRSPSPPPTATSTTFAVAPLQLTVAELHSHDIIASQAAAAGLLTCLGEPVHEATHTVDLLAASMQTLVTSPAPPGFPDDLHHSSMNAPAALAAAVACCVPLPADISPPVTHGHL